MLGFAVAVLPLALTPGASLTLTTTYLLRGERQSAKLCVVGTGLGILTHGTLAGLGLSAVVMRSAEVYGLIKAAAALYLVVLGIVMLRKGLRRQGYLEEPRTAGGRERRPALIASYIANVLNPKAAAVYLTLAPQFLAVDQVGVATMLQLAVAHVAIMSVWLLGWGSGLSVVLRRIRIESLRDWVNRLGGAALIFLGIRAAVTR